MSFSEEDLLPLSALQHLIFCPRQCALIHIEQVWSENLYTAEGRIMHERVDSCNRESRGKVRIEFGVPLRSLRLGLVGRADVVEFHQEGARWIPFPVEYKRGRPKKDSSDRVQLCAQAMCLEEMLGMPVRSGALFYGKHRRRTDVAMDKDLRAETEKVASDLHQLIGCGRTPEPIYSKKCDACSLIELYLPKTCTQKRSVGSYLRTLMKDP
jgi:CRISPR-associated exonuclease Cas4